MSIIDDEHEQHGGGVSRRRVLQAAGAGALLLGAGVGARDVEAAPATGRYTGISTDPVLHAVRRLTFGATPALVQQVRSMGIEAWLDEQLLPAPVPDPEVERILATFPSLRMPAAQAKAVYADRREDLVRELTLSAIVRASWSQRQVREVLVDFWTQHLNVAIGHDVAWIMKPTDDRDVVRAHALGRFADLLLASAQSPAMLAYLDNSKSTSKTPNQNYARELLELHTLGVKGGYTNRDIKDVAKVLSGWTYGPDLTFVYLPGRHATGAVRVLGWRHANATPEAGLEAGRSLLDYLAHHPNTAKHIARKLCVRLVKDNPSAALVSSTAQVYLKNDTQIAPMIRHIVASPEWRKSVGAKVRRPLEVMAASIRATDLRYDLAGDAAAGNDLWRVLRGLGHAPYAWPTPDGYPDRQSAWLSTVAMLNRWNFHLRLAAGGVKGLAGPSAALVPQSLAPTTAGALVDSLGQRLLFQAVPKADRATLLAAMRWKSSTSLTGAQAQAATPLLTAYLLSSSVHQLR